MFVAYFYVKALLIKANNYIFFFLLNMAVGTKYDIKYGYLVN